MSPGQPQPVLAEIHIGLTPELGVIFQAKLPPNRALFLMMMEEAKVRILAKHYSDKPAEKPVIEIAPANLFGG